MLFQLLLLLLCICCCDAATIVATGPLHLAFNWIVPFGAFVVLFIIRISPDTYILIYENDGLSQLVQIVMSMNYLQTLLPTVQLVSYPTVINSMQKSKHDPNGCKFIAQALLALAQPNLQRAKGVIIVMRGMDRFPEDERLFKRFNKLVKTVHSRAIVTTMREGVLLNIKEVMGLVVTSAKATRLLSATASHRDVTHTLSRDDEDEELQEEVGEKVSAWKESNIPHELVQAVAKAADLGDDMPGDNVVARFKPLLNDLLDQTSKGSKSLEQATDEFITFINNEGNASLLATAFSLEQLDAENGIFTRRSETLTKLNSKNFIDQVSSTSIKNGRTLCIVPYEQLLHILAHLQISNSDDDGVNDLSAIIVHAEQVRRRQIFKDALVPLVVLAAYSKSKLFTINASTLARLFADPHEGVLVMSILQSSNVTVNLAYTLGYDINQMMEKESWRGMQKSLFRSTLLEELDVCRAEAVTQILSSLDLDDDTKQVLSDTLTKMNEDMHRLSFVQAKRYDIGKDLSVSNGSPIASLTELPGLIQGSSSYDEQQQQQQQPNGDKSVIDHIVHGLAGLAIDDTHSQQKTSSVSDVFRASSVPSNTTTKSNMHQELRRTNTVTSQASATKEIQQPASSAVQLPPSPTKPAAKKPKVSFSPEPRTSSSSQYQNGDDDDDDDDDPFKYDSFLDYFNNS